MRGRLSIKTAAEELEDKNNKYIEAMSPVNDFLLGQNAPISPRLEKAVWKNLDDVKKEAPITTTTMHGREVIALAQDGAAALQEKEYGVAALSFLGAAANSGAFLISGGMNHQERYRRPR